MNPGDATRDVRIFDAMTCLSVVFHNLSRAAAANLVDLKEDGGSGAGDADAVFLDERLDHQRVDESVINKCRYKPSASRRMDCCRHLFTRQVLTGLDTRFFRI